MKDNVLTKKQLIMLAKGASLFTTGGGVSFREQVKTIDTIPQLHVPLSPISSFPKDAYICTAAEIGPANAPQINKKEVITRMVSLLQKNTKTNIVGVYPPEIGQESIIIETAFYSSLPIVDFDPVGFRAVPFLDINIFNLKNISYSFAPLVATTDMKEFIYIEGTISSERIEVILRQLTHLSQHRILFFIGGLIQVKILLDNALETYSYTKALDAGKSQDLTELISKIHPQKLIEAEVIEYAEQKKEGFLSTEVLVKTKQNKKYKLIILNEVLFLLDQTNKIIVSVPDRILLIDKRNLCGIPSGDLKKGKQICIMVVKAEKIWQGKKAEKLFGRNRFKNLL